MSRNSKLTTTSYAILGLLAVRSWSTYGLARQMDRSLGRIWPRAQSKIYEEPKKLVRLGLAHAVAEVVGSRPRTVYAISSEGRLALADWLRQPSSGPVLESEQLLKVFFAQSGTVADTLATLAAMRDWAVERNEDNLAAATAYFSGQAPFPERAAQNMLVGRFVTDYYRLVAEWSEWAADVVRRWPANPQDAQADPHEMRGTVRRASWSTPDSTQSR